MGRSSKWSTIEMKERSMWTSFTKEVRGREGSGNFRENKKVFWREAMMHQFINYWKGELIRGK